MTLTKTHKIHANGIETAYRLDGPTSAPVVMLVHALGTSHRIWDWQVPALRRRFRVLRYDWRGHGDTEVPHRPYSVSDLSADALALMEALDLDRVHWVGLSTGAMIGMDAALSHPARIASLTLCNTAPGMPEGYEDWVREREATLLRAGMASVWETTRHNWFTEAFVAGSNADYEAVQAIYMRTPLAGFMAATRAVAKLDLRSRLHEMAVPVRIIAAGDDLVTPVEQSCQMQRAIAGAQLEIVPGLRHFSNVESPAAFNACLLRALDAHLRCSRGAPAD